MASSVFGLFRGQKSAGQTIDASKRQKTKYRAKRGFSGASSWHIFNENFFKSIKMYKPDTNVGDKGKISQYNKKGGENPRKNYLEEIDP